MLKENRPVLALIVAVFVIVFVVALTTPSPSVDPENKTVVGLYDHEEQVCRNVNSYTDYEIINSCDERYTLVYADGEVSQ